MAKTNKIIDDFKDNQEVEARKSLLEELFQDYYIHRRNIYKVNLIRGIFFGFGSVLGATLVVALTVWLLTVFVGLPVLGEYIENLRNSLQR